MSEAIVKVAQVGCGYWGKNLARNFAELGALGAVVDGDEATARKMSEALAAPVRSWDEVLADPAIAGVSLATPAASHAAMAIRALEAGKHVFVEKPLALDPAEGERILAAANKVQRVVMVGHLLQYHPLFLELKRLVDEGSLGRLQYVYSNRLSLGKIRTEENVLWSFAPHDLSMFLALVGEEPDEVDAHGAAFINRDIADWCVGHLKFPSGVRGHVQAAWCHPFKEQRLVVVGDQGMAVFEDSRPVWDQRLALYRHRIDRSGTAPVPVKADPEFVRLPPTEPLRNECQHFLDCVRTGATPRTDGREGLRVLRVLHRLEAALQRSIRPAEAAVAAL